MCDDIQQWKDHKKIPTNEDDQKVYRDIHEKTESSIEENFQKWQQELNEKTLLSQKKSMLEDLKRQIGALDLGSHSEEVEQACQKMHDAAVREHGILASGEIWRQINSERAHIASELSKSKRAQVKEQLMTLFSSSFSSHTVIDQFLNGDKTPLAQALVTQHRAEAKRQIHQALSGHALMSEIEQALTPQSPQRAALICVIIRRLTHARFSDYLKEKETHLREQISARHRLEQEFVEMGLGLEEEEISLLGQCLWVPASVHHNTSLASNGSRFVYGGVSVQPKIIRTQQVIMNANQGSISAQRIGAMGGGQAGGGAAGGGGASGGSGSGGNDGSGGKPPSKIIFPNDRSTLKHIFRDSPGHLSDTQNNRKMIEAVANNPHNKMGTDKYGNTWYAKTNTNGTQTWVRTRNGVITNAGLNPTPRPYDMRTGLNNSTIPVVPSNKI